MSSPPEYSPLITGRRLTPPVRRVHHCQRFGLEPGAADVADRERDLINVEEWAEIRRLQMAEGMGVKAIVRKLGVVRNTVRAAVRSDEAPKYVREGPGSAVDAFEPAIRRLLAVTPDMPATVVAERIGWTRGSRCCATRWPSCVPPIRCPMRSEVVPTLVEVVVAVPRLTPAVR
jgi:hypothetical protein